MPEPHANRDLSFYRRHRGFPPMHAARAAENKMRPKRGPAATLSPRRLVVRKLL
jgi:hypothetical protein